MSERWEREIDELLRRKEGRLRGEPVSRRFARRGAPFAAGASEFLRSFLRRPPVEQFMIASIFLVALTFLLQAFGIAPTLAYWCGVLSLLFFVLAIALSVAGHRGYGPRGGTKRWRDRDIQYGSAYPSIWDSVRTWFRHRRRR
jgi:peptidoglycan/LPS O-acetylase OafA/YrhL